AGMRSPVVLSGRGGWGGRALRPGLAIAPGPLVVPLVAILAGRLIARVGAGAVIAAGGVAFAAGLLWWAAAVTTEPDYVGALLGGMLVTGVGVGLTLPTSFAAGTGALSPQQFATGSAVLGRGRQVGLAFAVARVVAALGTPAAAADTLAGFQRGWYLPAAVAVAAGAIGLGLRTPARAAARPSA